MGWHRMALNVEELGHKGVVGGFMEWDGVNVHDLFIEFTSFFCVCVFVVAPGKDPWSKWIFFAKKE